VVLSHVLVAKAVERADIPMFFGHGHCQSSHLCKCFWRLIGGVGNHIHTWCVNPWHIEFELSTVNKLHSTCAILLKKHNACRCGAALVCLQFHGDLYTKQMAVAEELFSTQPKLCVTLPTYVEFEHMYNTWVNIPGFPIIASQL
jgi:hypothetical protein